MDGHVPRWQSSLLSRLSVILSLALTFLFCFVGAACAQSAKVTDVYQFTSFVNGQFPIGGLVQGSDGNFYGTTYEGGTTAINGNSGSGTVFKVTPSGVLTVLHSFHDGSVANDGINPESGLVEGSDGNFYGTTENGGSAGFGTVFKMTPGGQVTILHSFGDGSVVNDGQCPMSALVQTSDGSFYGTTSYGGSTVDLTKPAKSGSGTVFKITPSGAEIILHSFGDGSVTNDGLEPQASLIQASDGNFYGTTEWGGKAGEGAAFRMTPAGQVTILHSFGDGTVAYDGLNPETPVIQAKDGNLYGTTAAGGGDPIGITSGNVEGTIYRLSLDGQLTILHSGDMGNVAIYSALVQGSDGNFYGTAGNAVCKMNYSGEVSLVALYINPPDSAIAVPECLIQGTDGSYYGIAYCDGYPYDDGYGYVNNGLIYKLTVTPPVGLPPAAPTGLTATPGSSSFIFHWNPSRGATTYNLYIGLSSGGEIPTPYYTQLGGTSLEVTAPFANGRSYYFEVTAVNRSGESGRSNEASATPFTVSLPAGLQMFSVPLYCSDDLDTLFGYSGVTLASWSTVNDNYVLTPTSPANQISIGQGYWARFPQAVTLSGPGSPADPTQNFDIPLTKGWNMIGDPFTVTVPITSLLFKSGTETFAQATSGIAPLVGATLYAYPAGATAYAAVTSLEPEQGVWILAATDTDVQVPHP